MVFVERKFCFASFPSVSVEYSVTAIRRTRNDISVNYVGGDRLSVQVENKSGSCSEAAKLNRVIRE